MVASLSEKEKLLCKKNWEFINSKKYILSAAKDDGRAEGIAEAKLELARKAKKMGLSIDDICNLTGLNKQDLENLDG